MKRILFSFPALLVVSATLLVVSCSKGDKGDTGAAGATGATGAQGAQGPKGDTGVANVIYSDWLSVSYTKYAVDTSGDSAYYATIDAPKLTNDILSTGEVKVYLNWGNADTLDVSPLPYFDGGIIINPEFVENAIFLLSNVDASTVTSGSKTYLQYRYVLIPGGVNARKIGINWNDYAEVKKYLGLKD